MNQLLGELSALSSRTHASERLIHDRAVARDAEVASKLDALRPQTLVDDGAAQEYQVLTLEKAKLAQVIALARQHLTA